MKKTIIILALSGISSMAYANDNFSGFSAELGFSSRANEGKATDFKRNGVNIPITVEKIEKTTSLSGIALKYTASLNDMMYVGLSYERDLQESKLGSVYASVFGSREMVAEFATIKNNEKFVFSPAYKVQDNLLLSLRLGMIRSTTDIGSAGEETNSIKNSGSLVGVGAQYALTNSIFIAGSYDMFSFKDKTYSSIDEDGVLSYKFKPGGSSINLSVGYRF